MATPLEMTEVVIEKTTPITITLTTHNPYQQNLVFNRIITALKSLLTKFHAGYFRITLSLGWQALLWKTLLVDPDQTADNKNILHHFFYLLHPTTLIILWSFSLFVLIFLSCLYVLRFLFFFNMVKAEFLHHVGVNYLFTPWISWLLLIESSPFLDPKKLLYHVFWWLFVIPVVALDVKIYGQWFTKGKRFLSTVANPTSQLSIIGNLVGAKAAAIMGWKESAMCLFSLGIVHYFVVFVTLYQRLSGADQRLPVMLRPSFFLFFAAPSAASLAWLSISGAFDTASKMLFYLSLFLFTSLVCRPTLFKRAMRRFNVAWWSYSFPITILALASTEYEQVVKGDIAQALMLLLLALSVLVSLCLVVLTLFNPKMLLPDNDPSANLFYDLSTSSSL